MEIKIKSLKFDADQKLIEFVEKKVSKLEKFYEGLETVDVTMSLLKEPENKSVKLYIIKLCMLTLCKVAIQHILHREYFADCLE